MSVTNVFCQLFSRFKNNIQFLLSLSQTLLLNYEHIQIQINHFTVSYI